MNAVNVVNSQMAQRKPGALNTGKFGQAGLTLLEAIAFLAIAGLVIGGALAMYSSASSTQSTGQTVMEYESIRTGMKGLYTGGGGYGTVSTNATLIPSKKIPGTLVVAAPSTITNSWGGGVVVMGDTKEFYVAYDAVPKEVCVGMLSSITASGGWTGYNVVAAAAVVGTKTASTGKVAPAAAVTACSNDENKVAIWAS